MRPQHPAVFAAAFLAPGADRGCQSWSEAVRSRSLVCVSRRPAPCLQPTGTLCASSDASTAWWPNRDPVALGRRPGCAAAGWGTLKVTTPSLSLYQHSFCCDTQPSLFKSGYVCFQRPVHGTPLSLGVSCPSCRHSQSAVTHAATQVHPDASWAGVDTRHSLPLCTECCLPSLCAAGRPGGTLRPRRQDAICLADARKRLTTQRAMPLRSGAAMHDGAAPLTVDAAPDCGDELSLVQTQAWGEVHLRETFHVQAMRLWQFVTQVLVSCLLWWSACGLLPVPSLGLGSW